MLVINSVRKGIDVVNDLTTTVQGKALDACQGKILNDQKMKKLTAYSQQSFNKITLETIALMGFDLSGADFSHSNLTGYNFFSAHLSGARFNYCNLTSVNFCNADLKGADFRYITAMTHDFSGADFTGAQGFTDESIKVFQTGAGDGFWFIGVSGTRHTYFEGDIYGGLDGNGDEIWNYAAYWY